MIFHQTSLPGVLLIDLNEKGDDRGYLCRTFCVEEFAAERLNVTWKQCSTTKTVHSGTIRGLHYQARPHAEIKLIRCLRGAVWDVLVNINPQSEFFGKWQAFELNEKSPNQLYVPEDYAHGFQSLSPDVEIFYMISEVYALSSAKGVSCHDPELALPWPLPIARISKRDEELPMLRTLKSDFTGF
jgi:dTDP-4-dehydrorhamnose 3,5-epimerase